MSLSQKSETATNVGRIERFIRNDRRIVLLAVVVIILLAGAYTVSGVGMKMSALEMTNMALPIGEAMGMGNASWTVAYASLVALMWWIMMIAMMTPSAAPTLLLFTALKRQGIDEGVVSKFSFNFLSGYLLSWAAFAVIATILQWGFASIGLLSASLMTINSKIFAGVVLLGAGLYQFSSVKNACLTHCRSPAVFLSEHFHPGLRGALFMGAHHGLYCLGCCWALMMLLFVGGVMNLYWIIGLALYVIAEKMLSYGQLLSKTAGVALVVAGLYFLLTIGVTTQ